MKILGLHPELAKRLPEEAMWPNTANCAECDAVNQALYNGAKWEDIQIHTIFLRRVSRLGDSGGSTEGSYNETRMR